MTNIARGEYIAFLDANDYWLSNRLERQVYILDSEPTVEVVGHLMRYEPLASKRTLGITGEIVNEEAMLRIRAGRLVPFPLSSALFRTASVRVLGGFDEELFGPEDLDLYARIAQQGSFVTINEVLGAYRVHNSSISVRQYALMTQGARFVSARIAAESQGHKLTQREFSATYKPTIAQRYGDLVQRMYRCVPRLPRQNRGSSEGSAVVTISAWAASTRCARVNPDLGVLPRDLVDSLKG